MSATHLPFSLLLPVYRGDHAAFLRRAFESATVEQTRRPDEVVLVQDGPVGEEIAAEIARIEASDVVPVNVLRLPENVGLARALEAGLAVCRHEVVARADADDVSLPDRFERQLPVIEAGAEQITSSEATSSPGTFSPLSMASMTFQVPCNCLSSVLIASSPASARPTASSAAHEKISGLPMRFPFANKKDFPIGQEVTFIIISRQGWTS